ncbi:MAG: hypothetical protein IPO03_15890 [Bacteroidetes bacterium]|nr:hypothetical protein [Bacteroidota bacterium]
MQILGGAADAEHPAFFKTLTGFSLPFSDPDNHLLFFFGDYNMDNIDELEVINTVADSNMEVSYYSRQDMFAHLLESKRTAIPNAQGRYAFAFGEMNVKGLKDLFIIDHNDLTAPKIMVSYYLVSFSEYSCSGLAGSTYFRSVCFFSPARNWRHHLIQFRREQILYSTPIPC